MRSRAALLLGWSAAVAVLAAGVALRMHTRNQVVVDGRVRPFDSDSAYHLRRARFAAEAFPRTILFDPLMNFPDGGVPIWPPLYDAALSLPARLSVGAKATTQDVARGAAWVPVVLAAGAIGLAGLLGRRLFRERGAHGAAQTPRGFAAGIAAAAFLAVCPGHILWSQYG